MVSLLCGSGRVEPNLKRSTTKTSLAKYKHEQLPIRLLSSLQTDAFLMSESSKSWISCATAALVALAYWSISRHRLIPNRTDPTDFRPWFGLADSTTHEAHTIQTSHDSRPGTGTARTASRIGMGGRAACRDHFAHDHRPGRSAHYVTPGAGRTLGGRRRT